MTPVHGLQDKAGGSTPTYVNAIQQAWVNGHTGVVLIYPAVTVGWVKSSQRSLSIPGLTAAWVEED